MGPRRIGVAAILVLALASSCSSGVGAARVSPTPLLTPSPAPSPAPVGFAYLSTVDPTVLQDMRYATAHNFVGRPIRGYLAPRCLLTQEAAQALSRVQIAARAKGYGLKVYDCYRPLPAGEDFLQWAKLADAQEMKAEFFPSLSKAALFTDGYVSNGRSAHSRGSTVDLTLVPSPAPTQRPFVPGEPLAPCTAPVSLRFPDNSIDMGTGYDCFDPRSHPLDPRITDPARMNRLLLRQLMTDAGFRPSTTEWWHFSLIEDPHPDSYYDFPVA
jgi:D-alanyl-D-alanine dipeptidase